MLVKKMAGDIVKHVMFIVPHEQNIVKYVIVVYKSLIIIVHLLQLVLDYAMSDISYGLLCCLLVSNHSVSIIVIIIEV
jgi:hypothetical protein